VRVKAVHIVYIGAYAYKCIGHETGCGVEDIDRRTVGDVGGNVEELALTVIVTPKASQVARLCTTATGVARPLRNQKFESYRINCSDNSQFLSCLFFFIATQKSTWYNLIGHAT